LTYRGRRLLFGWLLPLAAAGVLCASPGLAQPAPGDGELLRQARQELRQREFAQAQQHLQQLLARPGLEPELEEQAQAELERLSRRFTVHTRRIGLLAPLSGPYREIGEAFRRGAELALAAPGGPTVIVEDTRGTPEGAAAAVERLVLGSGVVALLGPVGDHECRAAGLAAAELEVPILLLGSAPELPGLSPWIFRHRVTPADQARAIAYHALFDLGIRTFAILFPDDEYGRVMMNAFWDEVDRGGGEVRGAEAYPAKGAQADAAIRRLIGGTGDPRIRPDPFEIRRGEKKVAYQPLVDFEALFLPETPRRARQILSQLHFYDVRLNTGGATGQVRAAHAAVQVLGPGSWNGEAIARGAEPVVQNAHFPGSFVPQSARPAVLRFLQSYRSRYGRPPNELEAQAYDAAGWLWVAWQRGAAQGRPALQQALFAVGGFLGVTGEVRVLPDGGTHTSLTILQVQGKDVVPAVYGSDRARGPASGSPPPAPAIRLR
jgi:ABC-type branched-subunit amino acid transport system substrate-binding protein